MAEGGVHSDPQEVVVRLEETINFKISDVTVAKLAQKFRLQAEELVLVDDLGEYILPNEDGIFNKNSLSEERIYTVDGLPLQPLNDNPLFSKDSTPKCTTFYYRVVEYCICNEEGKLQTLQTEPLRLNNETSNIHAIAALAQETFKLEDVELLVCTASGDPIEDSEETRGKV